jgi:hypothetical protein
VAVRRFHHRGVHLDALEAYHAIHPCTFDRPLALQLEAELDEERDRAREVVDHDAHVLHALDGHALDASGGRPASRIDVRTDTRYPEVIG